MVVMNKANYGDEKEMNIHKSSAGSMREVFQADSMLEMTTLSDLTV